jgi:hypothetical protein
MATKITTINDDAEGRRLSAAILRKFQVNAVVQDGEVITHDVPLDGERLKRIRFYADGWKDSLEQTR